MPNSVPTGSGSSRATIAIATGVGCPARSERTMMSIASGSDGDERRPDGFDDLAAPDVDAAAKAQAENRQNQSDPQRRDPDARLDDQAVQGCHGHAIAALRIEAALAAKLQQDLFAAWLG